MIFFIVSCMVSAFMGFVLAINFAELYSSFKTPKNFYSETLSASAEELSAIHPDELSDEQRLAAHDVDFFIRNLMIEVLKNGKTNNAGNDITVEYVAALASIQDKIGHEL